MLKVKTLSIKQICEKWGVNIYLSHGNKKVDNVLIFNLPAVVTCPNRTKGCSGCTTSNVSVDKTQSENDSIIKDFLSTKKKGEAFCYTLSTEMRYPNVRPCRYRNLSATKKDNFVECMVEIIQRKLETWKNFSKNFRWHEGGDIYSRDYFLKMCEIAKRCPSVNFLAYTRSFPLIDGIDIPKNFVVLQSIDSTSEVDAIPNIPKAYATNSFSLKDIDSKYHPPEHQHQVWTCPATIVSDKTKMKNTCGECGYICWRAPKVGCNIRFNIH